MRAPATWRNCTSARSSGCRARLATPRACPSPLAGSAADLRASVPASTYGECEPSGRGAPQASGRNVMTGTTGARNRVLAPDAWGPSVLVVEDDPGIATQLVRGLSRDGYRVEHVLTGREALARGEPDVVLLDLELPDSDGVHVCRRLRERSRAAIIVVTAHGEEADRVAALDAGADDYLVKPFGLAELQARIRAVLRRVRPAGGQLYTVGPLALDPRSRRVTVEDREIALTPKEFDILECLMADAGRAISRHE